MNIFRGIGVGSAAATGVAHILREQSFDPVKSKLAPAEEEKLLTEQIAQTAAAIRAEFSSQDKHSREIMDALLMILEDPELVTMARAHLDEGWDAAWGLKLALDDYATLFDGDADFASRAGDLTGLAQRVIAGLRGSEIDASLPLGVKLVVIAKDLTPLDTARFNESVVGVATELGGPTSHAAIICRARGIPAVVACGSLQGISDGDPLLIDPEGNRVVVGGQLSDATATIQFAAIRDEPLIPVRANIGSASEAATAANTNAIGVGLFRTEVMYLDVREMPSIQLQVDSYRAVFAAAPKGEITVRTLDAGSDKPVPFLTQPREENPALGIRGFRLARVFPEFISSQLDAISRAADLSRIDIAVMAPMIATVDEAKHFVELGRKVGLKKLGIMVETPAIATTVRRLKGVVDFLSIGTNDLSQYLFAADRMHPGLGTFLNPWQPALLATVSKIISDAREIGIPVGICGESAADPVLSIVFAGMGASSVSVSPAAVGSVDSALRAVTPERAKAAAIAALQADTAAGAHEAAKLQVAL